MAWRGAAGATTGVSSATTLAVTVSGIGGVGPQLNDIVLLSGVSGNGTTNQTFSCPGFSAVPGLSNVALTTSNNVFFALYKVAGAGEPSSYTVTGSGAAGWMAIQCNCFSGRNTTTPFTAVSTAPLIFTGSPQVVVCPTVTAAASDDLFYVMGDGNNASPYTATLTAPSGFSNVTNTTVATANNPATCSATNQNVGGGATGSVSGSTATGGTGGNSDASGYLMAIAQAGIVIPPVPSRGPMPKQIYIMP